MTEQKSVNDLTLKEATAEIGPLKAQLLQWGKEYYEQDAPTVEDYVYDRNYHLPLGIRQPPYPRIQKIDVAGANHQQNKNKAPSDCIRGSLVVCVLLTTE